MYSRLLWQLAVALPFTLAVVVGFTDSKRVFAQLTPDDTLGAESSIVTPQQLRDLIQGGAIRDGALFHSFDEFNVGSDRGVFFDLQNNTDILNIFTRVTGGNVSNILGTLGVLQDALNSDVLGNANLFLLNPNGITFGGNANLQLNGSFFATTADGFGFDNFTFSASGEEAPPPLLTISIPNFLDFRNNAGNIAVNGSNLRVNQGQNLSLVGGNISIDNTSLGVDQGTIQIVGLSGNGRANLGDSFTGNEFTLGSIETGTFNSGSVTINESVLNATATNLGGEDNIVLDAVEEIILTNSTLNSEGDYGVIRLGSYIRANTINVDNSAIAAENKTGEGVAGDIYLDANDIIITNNSNISGDGIIGIIFVGTLNPTQTITIDNSQITAEEDLGEGFAGDIYLDANDITITNGSNISGNGDFGRIFIGSSRLPQTVTINNSIVETDSLNFGRAGFITIDASQEIRIENTFLTSQGSFGNISIGDSFSQTPQRVTINGSFITTDSFFDFENAGTITIEATQEIDIDNSSLTSQGSSGNISIGSDSSGFEDSPLPQRVTINGSSITTDGFFDIFDEFENAGTITIEATQEISIENSFLTSQGSFGNISVGNGFSQTPQRVTISDSTITTDSFPDFGFDDFNDFDSAGSITIDATQAISIENSFLTSQGSFGNISIGSDFFSFDDSQTLQRVTISNSFITTDDFENAGFISVSTENLILDGSQITSRTSGGAGNINLNITDSLLLLNRSEISTSGNDVFGEGGNINISARFVIVSSEDNDIHADAKGEKAGDVTITIDPDGFIFGIQERDQDTPLSDITATSDVEDGDGDISINNQQATDPSQGLIELPEEIAEESTFIVGGVCSIGGGSEFIVRGRGGVPYIPGLVTQNDVVNVDLVDEVLLPAPPPEAIKPHHRTDVTLIDSEGKEFKPAMGAVLLPDGMVEFVDYNPAEVYRDIYASASCSR